MSALTPEQAYIARRKAAIAARRGGRRPGPPWLDASRQQPQQDSARKDSRHLPGGGGGGRGSVSAPGAARLTSALRQAAGVEALLATAAGAAHRLNAIHLSAAWNSLGHKAATAKWDWAEAHVESLDALVTRTAQVVSSGSEGVRARELSNIAHGIAKSGLGPRCGPLMGALAAALDARVAECNPQELANAAWAFAKTEAPAPGLLSELAAAAERSLPEFNAQELSNLAWAYATVRQPAPGLFAGLAGAVAARLPDFSAQGLSNTAWAFARAGHLDAVLFASMARAAEGRLAAFNAQDLANTAWAYAKLGQFDAGLFAALGGAVQSRLPDFSAQGLANTTWAFAKAGHLDGGLFAALGGAVSGRADELNAQDLANTAWAFAKSCHADEDLFRCLAAAGAACLQEFNTQDLVNTAWAFAKVGQVDAGLFAGLARALLARQVDGGVEAELGAQQLANLAWAFSHAGPLPDGLGERLFASLGAAAAAVAAQFSAAELASVAWAFANAGHLDAGLFRALGAAASSRLRDFTDEELDNAEWAFSRAGQGSLAAALRRGRRRKANVTEPAASALAATGGSGGKGAEGPGACGTIVVAGGGIGGAAAAVALQAAGFDVTVLEVDTSFDARAQGYGLTIQRLDALRAMDVDLGPDDAPSTSHFSFTPDGAILGFFGEAFSRGARGRKERSGSGRFVHIPRQVLRQRILERVRPGTIRWGSKLAKYECRDGGVDVTLTDGTVLNAALLVGSDGIFSTVRRQLALPGDRLNYVGLVVVLGIVDDTVLPVPLARRRIFETMDGKTRLYAMPFTTTSTMWQLSFPGTEAEAREYSKNAGTLKAEILRRCGAWHAPIPEMLRATPLTGMSGYPVYDRELLEPGVLRPAAEAARRVTLIGDAAHPMTPFKAQGANQAISDAALLADCLADGVRRLGPASGLQAALPVFEAKMLARSARMVVSSRQKAQELHSALALQPARKTQREAGVDMGTVIQRLRAGAIGAQAAEDPRGLDAVVTAVMEGCLSLAPGTPSTKAANGAQIKKSGKQRSSRPEATAGGFDGPEPEAPVKVKKAKKVKIDGACEAPPGLGDTQKKAKGKKRARTEAVGGPQPSEPPPDSSAAMQKAHERNKQRKLAVGKLVAPDASRKLAGGAVALPKRAPLGTDPKHETVNAKKKKKKAKA